MTAVPASPEPTNPSLNIYLPAFSGGVAGCWAGAGLGNVLENIFHIQLLLFSFIVLLKRKLDWRWKGAPQLIATQIFLTTKNYEIVDYLIFSVDMGAITRDNDFCIFWTASFMY